MLVTMWERQKLLEQLRARNKDGKPFYFLEGPPYTSGRVHLGTAWNMSLKDMFVRYKRMQGFNVWDRMGYDMHGLPIEHATEKKLGIKGKDDIQKFGVDKFVRECEKLCIENMHQMNKDFLRIGSTLDLQNAYQSITRDFISGEWMLIKKAHESGRLYEGLRTMHWDMASATGVAKHELEYKSVTDTSVYLKLKLLDSVAKHDSKHGSSNRYLLVWTTTPWTLPFNLGVMMHPDLDYAVCSVNGEEWVVAKSRVAHVMQKAKVKDFKIVSEHKGNHFAGLKYVHPFGSDIQFPQKPKLHTVLINSEYVDDTSGTGLVHCAPGCGPEDYEVGHAAGLPAFNTTDEKGVLHHVGPFTGFIARKSDSEFIRLFQDNGSVVALEKYTHDYPHDWRSHEPVIFRATRQWFFKVEDLKTEMIAANDAVTWHPDAGYNAFNSWLENLRDNSISKQRFWGTPLPVWRNVDNDADYFVVGSVEELEQLTGKTLKELHKPWIDDVVIEKNGKTYRRVPDVLDVWVDAGTTSWNCLYYPVRKDLFEQFFPADFILEGKDQIRGWFNLLLIASFLALKRPSFKAVYMHGFVTDFEGMKMSKSLGNVIAPDEVINKYSADAFRYYSVQTPAGEDMNFKWDEVGLKHRQLGVLWNIHKLLLDLCKDVCINPFTLDARMMDMQLDIAERVMFSKLHSTIKTVTKLFDSYKLDEVVEPIEQLYLSLSRDYIQLVREKMSSGEQSDKEVVAYTVGRVLLETLKMFSTVVPFVTEAIYHNLRNEFKLNEESIHLLHWPKVIESLINAGLERDMAITQDLMSAAAHARERIGINVRWPLKELVVVTLDENTARSVEHLRDVIKQQVNAKELTIVEKLAGVKQNVTPNRSKLAPKYGALIPKVLAQFGLEDSETLLRNVGAKGEHTFMVDETNVRVTREDIVVEDIVPHPYVAAAFKTGVVYLNQSRTAELDAEGYAREIMRRVQALRKDAGLIKQDRIVLYLKTGQKLKQMLEPLERDIAQKVGASKIKVDILDPAKKHAHVSQEKVKTEEFVVYFDKM